MRVEVISHPSGDELPILLDDDGLPITSPNEFILARRGLATKTLTRNLAELSYLFKWLNNAGIDPWDRISNGKGFSEAELRGGLVESLRRDQSKETKVISLTVHPRTFNNRLLMVVKYFEWMFDIHLSSLPNSDMSYERVRDRKLRTISWLESSFINNPPVNTGKKKGLTIEQAKFLTNCINPSSNNIFGRKTDVRFRNYVSIMIMLNYGLRPGELLSLKVEDIEFGAISALKITRRLPDLKDKRRPRPQIKRNGRVMIIDNPTFARHLNEYIMIWREQMQEKSSEETDYLIVSDEGDPLSQASIVQFFQIIRKRFFNDLPSNLTAKSLRHAYSSNMEKELREIGMTEDRRMEALADLRGDGSLQSQSVYIAEEIQKQANIAMRNYHKKLLG